MNLRFGAASSGPSQRSPFQEHLEILPSAEYSSEAAAKESPWCWEVSPQQHSDYLEGHMAGAGGFWAGTAFFVALEIVFWLFVQFTGGKGDKR